MAVTLFPLNKSWLLCVPIATTDSKEPILSVCGLIKERPTTIGFRRGFLGTQHSLFLPLSTWAFWEKNRRFFELFNPHNWNQGLCIKATQARTAYSFAPETPNIHRRFPFEGFSSKLFGTMLTPAIFKNTVQNWHFFSTYATIANKCARVKLKPPGISLVTPIGSYRQNFRSRRPHQVTLCRPQDPKGPPYLTLTLNLTLNLT